ncbi:MULTISPECIES: peptide ABC transporter substrate-binding protein [unclassified Gemella]|uniref:peptide ABC transporter substrate-binding protein n=1 Tax=unclassified Gemella TaxID=2624949 RepID=UPI001073BD4F|nr:MULTISPECIES: peptide ABC transporter substrate-binding protein [unclassified Gemella]MBF0710660.1 peptide ABC transporter substrate-binding protein [Gemella sp. GL1.1]MBF0746361.1 peptide ABC transporter substrate-binding protein [Gemella sp. 19428wG2_WT2a]NYS28004.1 peptide ABC transporter substrate-binding protein [Gemella sp. GL1]TFU60144.1 peptide ABC transporter substrate-binding protein [Gemella sp. WT2a]
MKFKKTALLGMMAATLTVVTACSSQSSTNSNGNGSKEINWYTPTEIITLDASKYNDTYSNLVVGNSNSNFFRKDAEGKNQPDLAEKVEVSNGGKTYTVTLKTGLKWSDGSELTAKDFVYSWQRIVDPKTAAEYGYLVVDANVANAKDVMDGKKPVTELGVKAEGNKVVFTLDKPAPQFESLLSFGNFVPLKEEAVTKAGDKYGTNAESVVSSGPYIVKEWDTASGKVKLVKNENYWNAVNVKTPAVNVQAVKKPDTALQMFKQGQLDFASIADSPAMYNANKNNPSVVNAVDARTDYLVYNETGSVKALSNEKIRKALNLATDREGLVKAAVDTGSIPAKAFAPEGLAKLKDGTDVSKFVAQPYSFNKEEAAKLFKEGLAELGVSNLTLTITADADRPTTKAAIDFLKETWESALPGFKLEQKFVPFKQRIEDTKKQNFEIAYVAWGGDYPEASTFYGLFNSTAPYNYGKVNSKEYDAALNKALEIGATNPDEAAKSYKEAEKLLFEGAHYNPIYYRAMPGLQNQALKGLVRNSTGLSVDFTYAYKE